ncbi:MAG TPA: molybdate ABC transporter substrate-binding protein [Polyangia bacterium]|nr:molybdate ABC transporter substrate-binding protein [Polyangia bacterium]
MRHPIRQVVAAAIALLVLAGGAGCAKPGAGRELIVFEASSLKDAFAKLAPPFEQANGAAKVIPNAAGSQELRTQIEHGAAADVFASADRKQMDALAAQGLVISPLVFTCNEPVLVVRTGLAATIKTLADLPRAERIVIGAPEVPIGAYTIQILQKAAATLGPDFPGRVQAKVASRELNVRQVLAKVVLGEADAGFVYRSDANAAAGKVAVVAIPPDTNVVAEYPIAALKAAPHPDLAGRWIELVRSPTGAAALREAGFAPCPSR